MVRNNLFHQQHLAIVSRKKSLRYMVTRSPASNGRSKPVTGRVGGPHRCIFSGLMTNSHTCERGTLSSAPRSGKHPYYNLAFLFLPASLRKASLAERVFFVSLCQGMAGVRLCQSPCGFATKILPLKAAREPWGVLLQDCKRPAHAINGLV